MLMYPQAVAEPVWVKNIKTKIQNENVNVSTGCRRARLWGPFVGASGSAGEPHQSQAWSDQIPEKTKISKIQIQNKYN